MNLNKAADEDNLGKLLGTPYVLGQKEISGRFAIPSGIRCTRASTIGWCFDNVPSVGIVTTKSISLPPRPGYVEPIYARYGQDSYINAVGLSNPGAEQFCRELSQIEVPRHKFLLVSIFGGNVKQFVETAVALKEVADGFELNMSCPHAEGYGVEIGQNRELVAEITAALVKATGLPVIVKLSAVVGDVGLTAKAAVAAGAAGITVSNTIGPATVNLGLDPILSNRVGGLSGAGIRPLALRSVRRVRDAIGQGPVLIGVGGVMTAQDAREFLAAGADFVGVGSALTGMDSNRMTHYFQGLADSLRNPKPIQSRPELPNIPMDYFETRVVRQEEYHSGLFKLVLESLPIQGRKGELAGKYLFLFIPGVGEKPFAVFCAEEKSIVVRVVGRFTRHLAGLPPGSRIYLRGPYGKPLPPVERRTVVMVGGGSGIASLLEPAKLLEGKNDLVFLFGGRSKQELFDLDRFSALGQLRTATNDGSAGHQGFVSDLLAEWLTAPRSGRNPLYLLCGPEPMVEACFKLLTPVVPPEDIWAAIEYMTSCGVGICGKCASPSGVLTCIDGPFLAYPGFQGRASAPKTGAVPAA